MLLKALTDGSIASTGTLTVDSRILGGILITTDNSTLGTVIVRRNDVTGKQVMKVITATSQWIKGPISLEGADTLYYSVAGSGCAVHLYEWIE